MHLDERYMYIWDQTLYRKYNILANGLCIDKEQQRQLTFQERQLALNIYHSQLTYY